MFAYTHPGTSLEALVDATNAVDAARRQQLLDQANQTDNEIAKRLATLNVQLKNQQSDLERQEREQAQVSDQLDAKLAALQRAPVRRRAGRHRPPGAPRRRDPDRRPGRRAAHGGARSREGRARAATDDLVGGPGKIITPPEAGPFQCPVQGAAYSDDYGGPTGHPGIDMFVPTGTVAVAVMAGTVRFVPNEGAGGNAAYLGAEDGNTYFYAHFSQFIGEGRTVAQGEVIGLTGMTGNASAPAPPLRGCASAATTATRPIRTRRSKPRAVEPNFIRRTAQRARRRGRLVP